MPSEGLDEVSNAFDIISERLDEVSNAFDIISEGLDEVSNAFDIISEGLDGVSNAFDMASKGSGGVSNAFDMASEGLDEMSNAFDIILAGKRIWKLYWPPMETLRRDMILIKNYFLPLSSVKKLKRNGLIKTHSTEIFRAELAPERCRLR